ncbi:serine/threonine-protein kinase [Paraliomyxa miuraensis]|uniref:serine/threonine-protein kinase n=1 Tax=Paraliomyxa miuraensis TaxID=376150 RepID=UPI002255C44D|nr:serine/threonine-protein kinase [Paraliomyxa miuraensis]MCX4242874.1 serine/threonine-protein kinase [Paraliomyxa miuraensis]
MSIPIPVATFERGDVLGHYVVLERLGAGAMGMVYAAYDPRLDRKVALKLLHAHGAFEEGSRRAQRLMREAQALAQLSHPNVVAVHDVGTAQGRMFLAMEYVQGGTLTAWLDQPRSWPQVLEVFMAAGRGLAAAHTKGLIHRDFKPENVMIGDDGRVRVMDFGLARVGDDASGELAIPLRSSSQELRVATQLTRTGAVLGTPAYMAPEQHLGQLVDTRSDQFSYCVALHEALYGVRPFAGETLAMLGMAITRGLVVDPPPGRAVPQWLRKVVLRGLSRSPSDRYRDMDELLRALQHDPRRHRLTALVGAGVLVAGGGLWLLRPTPEPAAVPCRNVEQHLGGTWDEERAARVDAALRATGSPLAEDTAERVAARLRRYAADWVTMRTESCEATRIRGEQSEAMLDLRNACLDDRLHRMRDLVEVLERADAEVVERAVGAVAELPSLEPCADVVALRSGLAPPDDPAVASEVSRLRGSIGRARAQLVSGRYESARALATTVLDEAQALGYAPMLAEAHALVGEVLAETSEPEAAAEAFTHAYFSALQVRHDEVAAQAAASLTSLVGYELARHEEGTRWGEHALAMGLRVGKDRLPEADARHRLGVLAVALGDTETSRLHHERSFALRSTLLPPDHPDLASSLNALGSVHLRRGEYDQALQRYRAALELREQVFGPHHPEVAGSLNNVSLILRRQGELADARQALERAISIYDAALGPDHIPTAQSLDNLGRVLRKTGDPTAAEASHRRAIRIRERMLGPEHPDVGDSLLGLGEALSDRGLHAEAEPLLIRALGLYERGFGPNHPAVADALLALGAARLAHGDAVHAEADLERARALLADRGAATDELAEATRLLERARAAIARD